MPLIVPGFAYRPVVNYSGGLRRPPLGLALHVCDGNGSQWGRFNTPAVQASSHFWLGKDGRREQYISADMKSWCQEAGNPRYLSGETEGFPGEPLNNAQLDGMAYLMSWGHKEFGWPLVSTDNDGDPGLICHGFPIGNTGFAGRASWGGHVCPGRIRSDQRGEILRRAGGQPGPVQGPPVQRTMVQGDNGADVAQLQRDLNFVGVGPLTPLVADGDFGALTTACVRQFQKNMGLAVDGQVGPHTLGTLHALVLQRMAPKK